MVCDAWGPVCATSRDPIHHHLPGGSHLSLNLRVPGPLQHPAALARPHAVDHHVCCACRVDRPHGFPAPLRAHARGDCFSHGAYSRVQSAAVRRASEPRRPDCPRPQWIKCVRQPKTCFLCICRIITKVAGTSAPRQHRRLRQSPSRPRGRTMLNQLLHRNRYTSPRSDLGQGTNPLRRESAARRGWCSGRGRGPLGMR